jgi:hypothetical protein
MGPKQANTLRITDLALQIQGPAGWVEPLMSRWQGWTGNQVGAPWTLMLTVGSPVSSRVPLFLVRPDFADGACRLAAPGFSGTIEPDKGVAHLSAHPQAGVDDLSIFVRTCIAVEAFARGGLLFHAAGVVRQGQGHALFGHSGSGKTTAARLSQSDLVLNDDLVLIKPGSSGWQLWGTPFGGHWLPQAGPVPLHGLLRLVPDCEDRLRALGPGTVLGEVVANSPVINACPTWLPALMARWQEILDDVPARALHFRKSPAFWEVVDAEFR